MEIGSPSPLCVVLIAAVGGYALSAILAKAIEAGEGLVDDSIMKHRGTETIAVFYGLQTNCLALGCALWSGATGIKLAKEASVFLDKLGLQTLAIASIGPTVSLATSVTGAMFGQAVGSLHLWGRHGIFIPFNLAPLGCYIMLGFATLQIHESPKLLIVELIVFLVVQYLVMLLSIILSYSHPFLNVFILGPLGISICGPQIILPFGRWLLRHLPGQRPNSGDFLLYSFGMVLLSSGLAIGTTAFLLLSFSNRPPTSIMLLSCAHVSPLCAAILGGVLGIYYLLCLEAADADKVAIGMVVTTSLTVLGVSTLTDSLGPCGTAGLYLGVACGAGFSLESAVILAKVKYQAPGAAGALVGALVGAFIGALSLSTAMCLQLLSCTGLVASMANLERIKDIGNTSIGQVKFLDRVVEEAVFIGAVGLGIGATGQAAFWIGQMGNWGFFCVLMGCGVAVGYSIVLRESE